MKKQYCYYAPPSREVSYKGPSVSTAYSAEIVERLESDGIRARIRLLDGTIIETYEVYLFKLSSRNER